jgi:hypothetical protein
MHEKGIFALRTATDLFGQLERDLQRVKDNPADSYAAFDFFVTAFHLKEWKLGQKKPFKPELRQPEKATWQICRQLANGSKHFEADKTHESVKQTEPTGVFAPGAFAPTVFNVAHLVVRIEAEPAKHLGTDSIRVDDLAEKLVEFWKNRI